MYARRMENDNTESRLKALFKFVRKKTKAISTNMLHPILMIWNYLRNNKITYCLSNTKIFLKT